MRKDRSESVLGILVICLHEDECCCGVENKIVVIGLTKLFLFATVKPHLRLFVLVRISS